ncbi:MAG TPA: hypothetical protein VH593_24880 [Ktedonobacteraceae bacterium]
MPTPILLIPPAINVIVTGAFAGVVLRQYLTRHRIYQLYWSIALSMAFLATVSYIVMLFVQPTSETGTLLFRIYYVLGGTLMPAWLGMGSIALGCGPRMTRICFSVLLLLSLVGTAFVLDATINTAKLAHVAGYPGTGILKDGPWLALTIILNTLGVIAIVGVAIYSGITLIQRQASIGGIRTSNVLWANVFILAGALLNATAGGLAATGIQSVFWLVMAVGWIVLFAGVLLASRRSRSTHPATPAAENTTHPVEAK